MTWPVAVTGLDQGIGGVVAIKYNTFAYETGKGLKPFYLQKCGISV